MTAQRRAEDGRLEGAALRDARALLVSHPAVDLHCDTIGRALAGVDLLASASGGAHAGPPQLVEGGFGSAVYVLWIPAHLGPERGWERLERMYGRLRALREALTGSARALSLIPALEDARVLLGDGSTPMLEERVRTLAAWRTCYVTLTWNTGNAWATSCEDTRRDVGLTPMGRELVARLDAAGIRVDISHLSDAAASDALDVAALAPIASHSSARALCPHSRNITDALARRVAERGGLIGVNVHCPFVTAAPGDATLDHVVSHVEHLWRVAGEETVALGTDFDGIPRGPVGFENATRLPFLVARLLERGHPPGRVARFVGENARRVIRIPVSAERSVGGVV